MKRLKIIGSVAAVALLSAVGYGYFWWQSPATSTGVDHGSQEVRDVLGTETSLKPWQTSYFSTQMPGTLRVKTSVDSFDHGSYLLTSLTGRVSDQIGVSVAQLGNNSLSEIPGVKVRLNQPATYSSDNRTYTPDGAYVFSRSDEYETAVFWQHGDRYAAVVASGTTARRAELEQALQEVVANWQWQ